MKMWFNKALASIKMNMFDKSGNGKLIGYFKRNNPSYDRYIFAQVKASELKKG